MEKPEHEESDMAFYFSKIDKAQKIVI